MTFKKVLPREYTDTLYYSKMNGLSILQGSFQQIIIGNAFTTGAEFIPEVAVRIWRV